MAARVLFVDFENVQKINLARVPTGVHVMIFYGATQKKIPEELVLQAQPLGDRLKWIKISGTGPNALDFHIAFYLGKELATNRSSECTVLSSDTGFDPLVRHLQAAGHACRRVRSLEDAFAVREATADSDHHFTRLLALLKKDTGRPAKHKGLAGKVKSWFPKLTDGDRQALIDRLFKESRVRVSENSLEYDV